MYTARAMYVCTEFSVSIYVCRPLHEREYAGLCIPIRMQAYVCVLIVTCIPIVRQRLGKCISETHVHATMGLLMLGNDAVNMSSQQQRKRCSLCRPCRDYITRFAE
jgi:hypothetical protein